MRRVSGHTGIGRVLTAIGRLPGNKRKKALAKVVIGKKWKTKAPTPKA